MFGRITTRFLLLIQRHQYGLKTGEVVSPNS